MSFSAHQRILKSDIPLSFQIKRGRDFREGAKPPLLFSPLPFINLEGKGARGIGFPSGQA
jgi:hypothetical protein